MARTFKKLTKEDLEVTQELFRPIDEIADSVLDRYDDLVEIPTRNEKDNSWHNIKISRRTVFELASAMDSNNNISHILGIDRKTLAKYFAKELTMARAIIRNKLKAVNIQQSLSPSNVVDRLFALKNYAGMSDDGIVEALEDEEESAVFTIVLPPKPDFSKDPDFKEENVLPFIDRTDDPDEAMEELKNG